MGATDPTMAPCLSPASAVASVGGGVSVVALGKALAPRHSPLGPLQPETKPCWLQGQGDPENASFY